MTVVVYASRREVTGSESKNFENQEKCLTKRSFRDKLIKLLMKSKKLGGDNKSQKSLKKLKKLLTNETTCDKIQRFAASESEAEHLRLYLVN